jgi:hypothetical protein
VYNKIAIPHIDDFFMGSTIFVYRQTGSGETYTMFGNMNDPQLWHHSPDPVPLVLCSEEIFKHGLTNCTINCSMLEIYN